MAKATQQQRAAIKTLARRANRRLERATEGQRRALESYLEKSIGAKKFSQGSAKLSQEQAALRIKQLEQFLAARSTTRKGWDAIKAENVRKANETFSEMGYDLTDDELADVLEQIQEGKRQNLYHAVNLVQAAKDTSDDWSGSEEEISEALAQKRSAQEALEEALKARRSKTRK